MMASPPTDSDNSWLPGPDGQWMVLAWVLGSPSIVLPLVISLPIMYGLSSVSSRTKDEAARKWRKNYHSIKMFAPFVLPTEKESIRSYTVDLVTVTVCSLLGCITNVLVPVMMRRIVDRLAEPTAPLPLRDIIIFVLLQQVITEIVHTIRWTTISRVESDIGNRIICHLHNKALTLSADYHDSHLPLETYNTVCSGGSRFARFVLSIFFDKIPAVIDLVVAVVAFWRIFGGQLAIAMVVISVVYVAASVKMTPRGRDDFEAWIKLRRAREVVGADAFRNWHTVAAFNNVPYEQARFLEATTREGLFRNGLTVSSRFVSAQKDMLMSAGLVVMAVLARGQIKTSNSPGGSGAGDFVMLLQYWNSLAYPLHNFVNWKSWFDEFFAESDKMIEIMEAQPTVRDEDEAGDFVFKKGDIEFDNVSFSYDGEREVVRNVSFKAAGGQTVAVVGETGGGKSTLLRLLCRAYDVSKGSIRVDGQDIRHVRLGSLMKHVAVVPQMVGVFNATLLENIRYGRRDATQEDCEAACEAAAFHKKIASFTAKYDEVVGEKGTKLSGGELQRLAIARALLRDSSIVLFDEAMSSLDSETEWEIQARLREFCEDKTVIVIGHRLATVAHADLILAVKDGVVVESGGLDELLERKGYFHGLWDKQRLQHKAPV